MENEFGDYQTPPHLVKKIIDVLKKDGINPEFIIEPTFGEGNFIEGSLQRFDNVKKVFGIEIQKKYFEKGEELYNKFPYIEFNLINDSFFNQNLDILFQDNLNKLVIGNPPWVTSSKLSQMGSINLPKKVNFKSLSGLDALTGKSNFDIAEFISISLIKTLSNYNGISHLALLVKNIVPQNILKSINNSNLKISRMRLYRFDAKKEFRVSADASLMLLDIDPKQEKVQEAEVYELDNPSKLLFKFGWSDGRFVSNIDIYNDVKNLDSKSGFVWRSGIKHDSSKIMELIVKGQSVLNGQGEVVDIEPDIIFNILKSSDIRKKNVHYLSRKKAIVTQRKIGEDTKWIKDCFPKTWDYLLNHAKYLDGRKSSIYKKNPRFSIFGIGSYSFTPYKVAISGMYKNPVFSLIFGESKPIMVDDTVYFLPFSNKKNALIAYSVLNASQVQMLLSSLAFKESKRPYTKEILMRIDIQTAAKIIGIDKINQKLKDDNLDTVTQQNLDDFISLSFDNTGKILV